MKKITIDFETYSEAGYEFTPEGRILTGKGKRGLEAVGACVYSEHPTCDIISLAYDLHDGAGVRTWIPGLHETIDGIFFLEFDEFLSYFTSDCVIEAWNVGFERWIWNNVAIPKYGFPEIHMDQWRCCMAKSKAYSMPASLKVASTALQLSHGKFDGKRLIDKFTKPRNPTKSNSDRRVKLSGCEDSTAFIQYNKQDVSAESEASNILPELSKPELKFWQIDQIVNQRGIPIDVESLNGAMQLLPKIYEKYNHLTYELTDGMVNTPFEIEKIKAFCKQENFYLQNLQKKQLSELLTRGDIPEKVRKLLEYRLAVNSTPVKKIPAMKAQLARDGRIHDCFSYYGAHTGRTAGQGVQVQNFPQGDSEIAERILPAIARGDIKALGDNPIKTLTACLRGFIKASPGHDFICSDYSAIEAVVLACLAGEDWRVDVFRTHGMIYELSASRVLKIPFEEFKTTDGKHHPKRKLGKVLELAFGYAGGIGAFRNATSGSVDFTDNDIEDLKNAWRASSPMVVRFWYKLKESFCTALSNPGVAIKYRSISYTFDKTRDVMMCTLPSGRNIYYHSPRLISGVLSYCGTRKGKWVTSIKLHGGILTENVVQAVARDILMYALYNLERSGYPVVLHVHDEIMAEVPCGFGSIEEFERIMSTLPKFCVYDDGLPWPVIAKGGWRGERFGKH